MIAVDLYGRCHDDVLQPLCVEWDVPLIEDAAEALGSRYLGRHAGTFGPMGMFSANSNKITTVGRGFRITDDAEVAAHVRHSRPKRVSRLRITSTPRSARPTT